MVKVGKIYLLLAAVLLLTACPDGNLLLSGADDEAEILIQSVPEGSVIAPGEDISLSLVYPAGTSTGDSSSDQVRIVLERDGNPVSDDILPADQIRDGSIRSIRFPEEVEPGLYRLLLSVERKGEVLSRTELTLFHVSERYRILGISSYPPSINPGSTGTLQAHLDVPAGGNPFLRWRMGRIVISEGYLSRGLSRTLLEAPATEGVYPVSLELFPEGPPQGETFAFTSQIRSEVNLFVSSSVTAASHELSGSGQYYTLLNLRGDRVDRGSRSGAGKDSVHPVGERQPVLGEGKALFGYQLDGTNGLQINDLVLPTRNGVLEPFSLILKGEPRGEQDGRILFTVRGADGSYLFRVLYGTDGRFRTILSDGETQLESRSDAVSFKAGEPFTLILSVIPGGGEISFLWFLNGIPSGAERKPDTMPPIPTSGESLIGGEQGFRGILDEFGIYYRDGKGRKAVYADGFLDALKERYGADLIFAEGFDGLYLPESVVLNGTASFRSGNLSLTPDGSLVFPPVAMEEEVVVVQIVPMSGKSGRLTVSGAAGNSPLFQADLDGTVTIGDGERAAVALQNGMLELRIMQRAGRLFLLTDSPNPLPLGAWDGKDLEVALFNPLPATSALLIDSISFRRESLPGRR